MAKCKERCPEGPKNGYLISFGDTMTALLAFFIVLNSLAEEQTGANMHAGTGSFMKSVDKFGLQGKLSTGLSAQAFQHQTVSPKYVVPDKDGSSERGATGPDEDADNGRVLDRVKDDYNRFLQSLRQVNNLEQDRDVTGEVSFDILEKFPSDGSLINDELRAALTGVGPMLRRDDYAVELIVWTPTPSQSAWLRSLKTAQRLQQEAVQLLRLPPNQIPRITAVAQPWISPTLKRPTVSVSLRRLKIQ
ncbi:MAG: flagellar motor protein MotB [Fuerstiella sp.]